MIWWLLSTAHAGGLCDALLRPTPRADEVRQALVAGEDPNQRCRWREQVPMSSTVGGLLFAVFVPIVSWPIVFTETVDKKRTGSPLYLAVRSSREDIVEILLDAGARPESGMLAQALGRDQWGVVEALLAAGASPQIDTLEAPLCGDRARLARAVALGVRLDGVTAITEPERLMSDPDVADAFLRAGLPPRLLLAAAVEGSHLDVLDRLLVGGVPAPADEAYGLLADAAQAGQWPVVQRLHDAGVPWERAGAEPILVQLVTGGAVDGLGRAIRAGADPEARSIEGEPVLQLAVRRGRLEQVSRLIAAGSPVDGLDARGGTALSEAAALGRDDLVAALLAKGASVHAGFPPPVSAALSAGKLATAGKLLAAGAVVPDETVRDLVARDRADSVAWLLRHGVRADARLPSGETLAAVAVTENADAVLRVLIAAHAPLDDAAVAAVAQGDAATVTSLLDAGAGPAYVRDRIVWDRVDLGLEGILMDRVGAAPPPERLFEAVVHGEADRVRRMLEHGTNPNATDPSPLEVADPPIEGVLLAHGARPPARWVGELLAAGATDRLDRLALTGGDLDPHWPLIREASVAEWAARHGANRDLGLLTAAQLGRVDQIVPLVRAGARLDARNAQGWTALQVAMSHADDPLIDALLYAGQPYDAALVRYDAQRCSLDRLSAATWSDPVRWRDLRRVARAGGCRQGVRAVARGRRSSPESR